MPPMPSVELTATPVTAKMAALPLRLGAETSATAQPVASITKEEKWARVQDPFKGTTVDNWAELAAMAKAGTTIRNMVPVYFSPDPYHKAFEERLDMRRYTAYTKPAGGTVFDIADERLVLRIIVPSLPAANIPA